MQQNFSWVQEDSHNVCSNVTRKVMNLFYIISVIKSIDYRNFILGT